MAKAIDIGTSFIVGAELKGGKEVFTIERDAFFSMAKEDFAEEMLNDAGAKYLVKGDQIYVVGEDALKYCMITGKQDNYRRPMKKGVLNPGEEESIPLLERLIEGIVGKPSFPGEVIAATIPAAPLDEEKDVTFHKIVVERFLKKLGYDVRILNEALAIIYAENPTVADSNGGAPAPFSGIGISFGAGMTNLVVSWRAKKLFEISVARGGDWIDESVSKVRNVPVGKVTHEKEKRLNLSKVDPKDSIGIGLEVYYEELIRYTLKQFAAHFKSAQTALDSPMEIVIAGGTSMVPGFIDKFNAILAEVGSPLPIRGVRHAKDPLKTVAKGSLVAALSMEKKKLADEQKKKDQAAKPGSPASAAQHPQPNGKPVGAATAVANSDAFPDDIDLKG
jgi:actin-like ATPase involved in cell morphogenesis